jgi:hypothetical protein
MKIIIDTNDNGTSCKVEDFKDTKGEWHIRPLLLSNCDNRTQATVLSTLADVLRRNYL